VLLAKGLGTRAAIGRQRNIDARAQEIAAALRIEQLAAPAPISAAHAAITRAAVGVILGARVLGEFGDDPNR
jgi:hypothetical protein